MQKDIVFLLVAFVGVYLLCHSRCTCGNEMKIGDAEPADSAPNSADVDGDEAGDSDVPTAGEEEGQDGEEGCGCAAASRGASLKDRNEDENDAEAEDTASPSSDDDGVSVEDEEEEDPAQKYTAAANARSPYPRTNQMVRIKVSTSLL